MFGFIASPCPRCTSEAFPYWRGTFCGLARLLARDYTQPARLLVNRDATFLALLGLSIDPLPPNWRRATCCNPSSEPFPVDDQHPAVAHAAAVSVCGLATKLKDDSYDERGLRRLVSKAGSTMVSPVVGRAIARLNSSSFPTANVISQLAEQEVQESSLPIEADDATACAFGAITAHLADLLDLPAQKSRLARLGSAHGRLVYWRDAWDDRLSDQKKGRFNPYHKVESARIEERIKGAWHEFTATLSRLPLHRHSDLLAHIGENTGHWHADFLGIEEKEKKEKERVPKERNGPCHYCDCIDCCHCPTPRCSSGSSSCGLQTCFDCGPGDSGCIDCCPCDGCDCCPCN